MSFYSVKLKDKKEIARETTAFFFEKPNNFKFISGQFIELHLDKNLVHTFSIASSPKEKELMIATIMRLSAFKKSFKKLKIDSRVKIDGPFGQFVLHNNKKIPTVLLAGGIGITPFRSMIKDSTNRKIILFYSNRREKDAAFLKELKELEKQNKSFRMIAMMTKEEPKNWQGLRSHINSKIIKGNFKDWQKAVYYAVGSAGFVQAMANLLSEMKIKPEKIKTENFSGY